MKKFTKILLILAAAMFFLTGCYQQDITLNFKHSGAEFSTKIIATDEAYNYYFNNGDTENPITHQNVLDQSVPNLEEKAENDENLDIELLEKDIDGEMYYGITGSGKYKSAEDMLDSEFFAYLNSISMYPKEDNLMEYIETNKYGIAFSENTNALGTTYKINGYTSLTQGRSATDDFSEEDRTKLENAKSTLKFKFPVFSFSFSKGNKFFLAPSFVYELNNSATDMPIDISVFIPNYIVLAFGIIIILLIIIIMVLLRKIKRLTPAPEETDEPEEEMLSEDDENFFEGNEENTEFAEELPETREEQAEDTDVSENEEDKEDKDE